ncbi:solute carrier family 26 member 10-like isoform X6 [Muntiacus reevesi]|uniref:solute carrier family 26 member 10-like isoform X6 n=1 Tax=Muntiacus reevesi TaxID=9886 RepID=UPI003307AA1E
MSGLRGARTCPGPGEASDLKSPLGAKFREPLTETRFQQLFGDAEQEPELLAEPRWSRLWRRRARACSGPGAWRLLLARLPPLRWLPHYRWRAWLLGDAVAGLTVGIVHVPQGMAFALLTAVPPVIGLYTSFFPVLIYTLLGTGRHLSTGTFAVLSLMTGSAVERLVPEPLSGNLSGIEREQLDAQRVGAAAAVAFGSGALMLGMFALQLGVLATFLSEPVVKALTSGAALHVLVSQLPSLLGVPLPRQIGCFALFKTLAAVLTALPRSSPAELTISALSLALLVPVKELNVRFRDRLPTPIPGEIAMVLLASVLCFTSSLDTRYNVQIVGLLPGGFPQPLLPSLAELPRLLADSLPMALVTFAVSASLASIYADKYGYTVDSNQLSSSSHCILLGAPGSRGLQPRLLPLLLLSQLCHLGHDQPPSGCWWEHPAGGPLLLPGRAVRAAVAGAPLLLPAQDVLPDARTPSAVAHQPRGLCCVGGHVGGCRDSECGPGPGCRRALLSDDCGLPHPECLALGLAEGTELYRPLRESHKLLQVPGLCILSYPAPLYFGTRGQFRRILDWHLGLGEGGKGAPKTDGPPGAAAEPVRVAVLDCSGVTFADAAGAREVVQLASRCRDAGIHLLLAQCNASVRGTLTQAGLLDRVTPEQLFVSVQDAAAHALERLELSGPKTCTVWV